MLLTKRTCDLSADGWGPAIMKLLCEFEIPDRVKYVTLEFHSRPSADRVKISVVECRLGDTLLYIPALCIDTKDAVDNLPFWCDSKALDQKLLPLVGKTVYCQVTYGG